MGIEYTSVSVLARDLGRIPLELRAELRPQLQAAARIVADRAKANASWSSRIPGAIGIRTAFGVKTGGAYVRVDRRKAPHARALEGIGTRGTSFRHPVYGNRDTWVDQPTRPFLMPAAAASRTEVRDRVADAVRSATRHLTRSFV